MTPPRPEIKIPTATTFTSRTSISAMTTGCLTPASVLPPLESRTTMLLRTIHPISTPTTTLTSAWTTPSSWLTNKLPSSKLSSDCNWASGQLTLGISVLIQSTITIWTACISAISVSVFLLLKLSLKDIPRFVLCIILLEMRFIEMKNRKLQSLRLMVIKTQFTAKT